MPPLRVAMLLPGLGRIQRGAETAFIEIARGLNALPDVHVELFGSGRDGIDGTVAHVVDCLSREKFERWPRIPTLRGETYYEELGWVLNLAARRVFRPRAFDATVTCCYPWVNWFSRLARRNGGPRHIFVTQNGDWPCLRTNSEYRFFDCDGVVCTNPEYFERQRGRYTAALIPNGVDPEIFRPAGEAEAYSDPRIPDDRPIVLMAAALTPTKRVADGIKAIALVPSVFALIVGDGPLRGEIAELCSRLLPNRHLMLGSVPRERMASVFRRGDVFLHMSREEPFGIVYLEAAASGLPIVAHDAPNPRWILGETALLVDTDEIETVQAAIRRALHPDIRGTLGRTARERAASDWTWKRQAARYRDFIELVLNRNPRGDIPAPHLPSGVAASTH